MLGGGQGGGELTGARGAHPRSAAGDGVDDLLDRAGGDDATAADHQGRRRCPGAGPMPRENLPTRLVATPARPVISMTSLTREALMLWVAAMERRCERALRPGCTPLASSRPPTSRSRARCCR